MQPLPKRGSGLDYHYSVVQRTLLAHQDPVTGLLPAHQIEGCENHAWIRFAGFIGCLFVHEIGCETLTRLIRLGCLFVHEIGYENVDQGQRLQHISGVGACACL